jgi:alkaline phosphatase D
MKSMIRKKIVLYFIFILIPLTGFCQKELQIKPQHEISLKEAHIGNFEIDTMLLNSYGPVSSEVEQFYIEARNLFVENKVDFIDDSVLEAARRNGLKLLGGPMLGNLKEDGVSIWVRPVDDYPIVIKIYAEKSNEEKIFNSKPTVPGKELNINISGLNPNTEYTYDLSIQNEKIREGKFRTSPSPEDFERVRITFGSCFHKIGVHNPNLIREILKREPHAMMLLGDIAVDDRENQLHMHRSDYLLRDLSAPWKEFAANIPLYSNWDDHDYINDDLGGIPERFSKEDIEQLREVWNQNWINPQNDGEGVYLNTRIGQVELIMLDTRSLRKNAERGQYGAYLGEAQQEWLKEVLVNSTADFKIISSGTMWSDYITNGKDSWGTWDTLGREEIFDLIDAENISGVLLISGDRHGARGFTIPTSSGNNLYEFEVATLGGVQGPAAMANDQSHQLFGYPGKGLVAFGEFTFIYESAVPFVVFRLINESGEIMEEHQLTMEMLTPKGN